jgi:hypothetical protein
MSLTLFAPHLPSASSGHLNSLGESDLHLCPCYFSEKCGNILVIVSILWAPSLGRMMIIRNQTSIEIFKILFLAIPAPLLSIILFSVTTQLLWFLMYSSKYWLFVHRVYWFFLILFSFFGSTRVWNQSLALLGRHELCPQALIFFSFFLTSPQSAPSPYTRWDLQ